MVQSIALPSPAPVDQFSMVYLSLSQINTFMAVLEITAN